MWVFTFMIGIYKITNPSGKIYIGQSVYIEGRLSKYKSARCKTQRILYNSIFKHGWENHVFEIIEECTEELLNERERYYQDFFDCVGDNGMNCMLTGTHTKSGKASKETINILTGRKLSDATRLKMSQRKASEETRLKISQANIGRIVSEETRLKISESNKGRKLSAEQVERMKLRVISEEQKERLRTLNIGKKYSEEHKAKLSALKKGISPSKKCLDKALEATSKKILNTVTGEVHNSIVEVAKMLGMKRTTLSAKLRGQNKNNTQFIFLC